MKIEIGFERETLGVQGTGRWAGLASLVLGYLLGWVIVRLTCGKADK